jgi:uncharacterized protein (UPF0303 family)
MTTTAEARALVPELEAELGRLVLPSFDNADAWVLGSLLVSAAVARDASVTIDIRRPVQILFHHARPGTTADNDTWVDRKSRTAFHFEESSWLVRQRFLARGEAFEEASGLDLRRYAAHGGAVPLRVAGAGTVAVVTVSGLPQREDHELVVTTIAEYLK